MIAIDRHDSRYVSFEHQFRVELINTLSAYPSPEWALAFNSHEIERGHMDRHRAPSAHLVVTYKSYSSGKTSFETEFLTDGFIDECTYLERHAVRPVPRLGFKEWFETVRSGRDVVYFVGDNPYMFADVPDGRYGICELVNVLDSDSVVEVDCSQVASVTTGPRLWIDPATDVVGCTQHYYAYELSGMMRLYELCDYEG